jgi:hypothetical protein
MTESIPPTSEPYVSVPAQPVPAQPVPATSATITQIGDINVSSSMIMTPAGAVALRGSQWAASDEWLTDRYRPKWAFVAAIVGVCFTVLLSLLLLLVRTESYRAVVTVSVMNGSFFHTTRITVGTPEQVQEIYDRVNYVRSLALL